MISVIIKACAEAKSADIAEMIGGIFVNAFAKQKSADVAEMITVFIDAFANPHTAQITIMVKRIEIIALGQSFAAIKAEMIFFAGVMLFPCPRIAAIEIAEVIVVIVIAEMSAATKVTIGILVLIPAIMPIASIVAFGILIFIRAFTEIGIRATIVTPMVQILIHAFVIHLNFAIITSAVFICVCVLAIVIFATVIAFMITVGILANAD